MNAGVRDYDLNDLMPSQAWIVPMDSHGAVAVVSYVDRPVDGDLFFIEWQGMRMFRRLTRVKGKLVIVAKSSRTQVSDDDANELKIIGRVMFTINFPNRISDETLEVLNNIIIHRRY